MKLLRTNLRLCFSLHTYTKTNFVAESLGVSFLGIGTANENPARLSSLPCFRLALGYNSKVPYLSSGKKMPDDYKYSGT